MTATFRTRLLASTLLLGAVSLSTPALAQNNEPTPNANAQGEVGIAPAAGTPNTPTAEGDIVVTGTLIRDPNVISSSPVGVIGQEELQLRQTNVAEEVLRTIPGVVPSIGSQVNNGNGGASFVNLRGLGSNRNLVLLDGSRIAPAGLGGQVDLNNIPLALVERVDNLTGGASSTYGADAVAGVINFITRSDFTGMELNASEQITERGDGNFFRGDLTLGANLDDGRGNVVLSLGYQESDPVYFGGNDRPNSQVTLESYDRTYTAGQGSSTTTPSRFDIGGGRPAQQVSADGAGIQNYYAPFNFNPDNVFQVPFKRYNMYGAGHYDVADNITVYARGLFSDNTVTTIIAPSGVFGSAVSVPVSNPFLSAAQRNYLCANADTNTAVAGNQTLTAAQCAAAAVATSPTDPNYRTFNFGLRRRTVEAGPRTSAYNTQIFDFRGGIRGDITSGIGFDLSGSYGRSRNTQNIGGYVLLSRARQALLATNTTTCLTDTNGCVPLNVFGPAGSITQQMANFLTAASTTVVETTLGQARGVINGDIGFGSPFSDSHINIAVGAEYRKYGARQQADTLAQTAGELGGAGGAAPNIRGGYDVVEGFGEIVAPLVTDRPFFQNLQLEAGIRQSHYKVDAQGNPTFNTTTWKAGGSWAPISDLKLRGTYQRAARAPNIGELFSPISTGLTNLGVDPCAGANPVNNANLRAVCLAQGAPAATIGFINNPTGGQAAVTGGGNPALRPEIAKSYTFGAVVTPSFFRGFTASADYYHIKVSGAVSSPTPADLIAACFGSSPTNPPANAATSAACTVIGRNPITGGLDGDPATTTGLFSPLSNLGTILTSGIDVNVSYRTRLGQLFGEDAALNLSFVGNWTEQSKFQATPTSLNRECTGYYSVNCGSLQPEFSFNQRTTLSLGRADISLLWRFISPMRLEPQQLADDIAAAEAANRNAAGVLLPVAQQGCPNYTTDAGDAVANGGGACLIDSPFRRIGARHYFDLATRFSASDTLEFTITVQNLLDKSPPTVGGTVGSTTYNGGNTFPSTYDPLGRKFAVGARLKF
ncbi:TonB-dependent receptor [Sphingomonas sp. RHCKR47]|uniref:TonB-dependent receptor domain-containing protein n=1 Tax=Sphingomonas citricola TaxID=2862498 RepID=UPI001CA54FD1|nr:TonB-dependent receptor [Sphingomonas citricola]MBW6522024.1 TonB-dependent receptor [Sphingomonas citricola]